MFFIFIVLKNIGIPLWINIDIGFRVLEIFILYFVAPQRYFHVKRRQFEEGANFTLNADDSLSAKLLCLSWTPDILKFVTDINNNYLINSEVSKVFMIMVISLNGRLSLVEFDFVLKLTKQIRKFAAKTTSKFSQVSINFHFGTNIFKY